MWLKRSAFGVAVLAAFVLGFLIGRGAREDQRPRPSEPDLADSGAAAEGGSGTPDAPRSPLPRTREHVRLPDSPADETASAPPNGRLALGRTTLLSRAKHRDYEAATFSFEHGIRDDPGNSITGNDWELEFGNGGDTFGVRMSGGDLSTIDDIGEFTSWDALLAGSATLGDASAARTVAVVGHAYLVHTIDSNSDHTSVFRVTDLVAGDRVTIEWADWTAAPPPSPDAPVVTDATRDGIATFLDGVRERKIAARREAVGDIADPADILLQLRTGAQGGHHSIVTLGDPGNWSSVRVGEAPLDVTRPLTDRQGPTAYVRGGFIPAGQALVIESVDAYANAQGDSNGDGAAILLIGRQRLLELHDGEGPAIDWLDGVVVLRPGEERSVHVEVANSSAISVRLRGRFVPLEDAAAISTRDLWAAEPPSGAERVVHGVAGLRSSYLAEPRAALQIRAGHQGGNPLRVSLLGKASQYIDRIANAPLSFTGTLDSRDSDGYVRGGQIPRGKGFLVTRVDYRCVTTNESHGSAFVSLMGTTIAGITRGKGGDDTSGSWTGAVVVPAGSEKQVFVEASYFSWVEATLYGEFIDLPREDR